jgi:hypothetical protein
VYRNCLNIDNVGFAYDKIVVVVAVVAGVVVEYIVVAEEQIRYFRI